MESPATAAPRSTMRRDVISAWFAAGARVASWVAVSAFVVRYLSLEEFAMLALVRGTIGILNYAGFGLTPAMIRLMAAAKPEQPTASPSPPLDLSLQSIYSNGLALVLIGSIPGILGVLGYVLFFRELHHVPASMPPSYPLVVFVAAMGVATIVRLLSEPSSALLQVRGKILQDNVLAGCAELVWAVATVLLCVFYKRDLSSVGAAYFLAMVLLQFGREILAKQTTGIRRPVTQMDRRILGKLLTYGGLVTVAQMADYLYAPVDFILINRLLDPVLVGSYAVAVQVDTGLHLLVLGIASVLLPNTAIAHAAGDVATVRRYYLRGTLASVAITLPAALVVWALSGWIFQIWLGTTMPATQAILPLVLLHNLIGGSGTVGRSVLLAMGKVKPYAVSVLIAGVVNVVISYLLVRFTNLGLYGIVLGTICAVTGRALLWQPSYVMHAIRRASAEQPLSPEVAESIAQVEMRDAP